MSAVEWVAIVAFAALSTTFLVLLLKGLIAAWRTQEIEFAKSPRSRGQSLRRVYLTRVLPFVLLLILVQVGGASVGAATGHGAMTGLLVASVALMGALALGGVAAALVVSVRGARKGV